MKAICVTPDRKLQVRDIPAPEAPPPGHVLVDMAASTITHGDKFFLTRPLPGNSAPAIGRHGVYGANGAGRVVAIGAGVPDHYAGKPVAIYKSLGGGLDSIGLWCERAQVPFTSCLILPDDVSARDYCGSLANVVTVHAFLAQITADGHEAIVVTAGNSATGRAAVVLARRCNLPAIFLVRSETARDELLRQGATHVLASTEAGFENNLAALSVELRATAVFDGVGGELLNRVLPTLPMNSVVHVYGFLGAATPISLPATLLMGSNLTLRRFANLESATVRDPERLAAALAEIGPLIADPMFRTRIGAAFAFDQIDRAMRFETTPGFRAVLVS